MKKETFNIAGQGVEDMSTIQKYDIFSIPRKRTLFQKIFGIPAIVDHHVCAILTTFNTNLEYHIGDVLAVEDAFTGSNAVVTNVEKGNGYTNLDVNLLVSLTDSITLLCGDVKLFKVGSVLIEGIHEGF